MARGPRGGVVVRARRGRGRPEHMTDLNPVALPAGLLQIAFSFNPLSWCASRARDRFACRLPGDQVMTNREFIFSTAPLSSALPGRIQAAPADRLDYRPTPNPVGAGVDRASDRDRPGSSLELVPTGSITPMCVPFKNLDEAIRWYRTAHSALERAVGAMTDSTWDRREVPRQWRGQVRVPASRSRLDLFFDACTPWTAQHLRVRGGQGARDLRPSADTLVRRPRSVTRVEGSTVGTWRGGAVGRLRTRRGYRTGALQWLSGQSTRGRIGNAGGDPAATPAAALVNRVWTRSDSTVFRASCASSSTTVPRHGFLLGTYQLAKWRLNPTAW